MTNILATLLISLELVSEAQVRVPGPQIVVPLTVGTGGGAATNAIGNNGGEGTNTVLYGTTTISGTLLLLGGTMTNWFEVQNTNNNSIPFAVETNNVTHIESVIVRSNAQINDITKLNYRTNAAVGTLPDFNIPYGELTTNNNFVFLAPANVLNNRYQSCVVLVTNSTAAAKTIAAPANCFISGTAYVTNVSVCSFFNNHGVWTNLIVYPIW